MRIHSSFPLLAAAAALIVSLSSCGNGDNDQSNNANGENVSATDSIKYIKIADSDTFLPSWSKENTLIYHNIGEPNDMHPTNGTAAARTEINIYTQMFLMQADFHNLGVQPGVAKAMPKISENALEYTYELRTDVKWDDGSPLTAEDVIFTFKANKCPLTNNPHAKPYLDNLKDIVIDKANPNVITLYMKRKYIQNINFLTDYPIMQRSYFDPKNVLAHYSFEQLDSPDLKADTQKDLNDWGTEFNSPKYSRDPKFLVGAGPYKFAKWEPGQTITLIRKENHWSKGSTDPYEASYPNTIIFKINADPNSQILEFKTQVMDASTSLDTKTLKDLQEDPNFNANYNSRFTDTYNYSYIAMNMKPDGIKHKKIFTDPKVRRAMAYLVPIDDVNTIVNKGMNKKMVGPVSPLKPEYNTDLQLIPFDVQAAIKLLDEAGWKDTDGDNIRDKVVDGEKIKLEFNLNYMTTTVTWKDMAQMTSEAMYKAGVKANINPMDFAIMYDRARNHDFDAMIASWAGSSAPEDFTQIWHTSSWASKGSNFGGFGNAESDAVVDSIKYAIDDAVRIPLVKKLQALIYEQQPYVFLFAALRRNVTHKRFGNTEMYFERPGLLLGNLKLLNNSIAAPAAQP